MSTDCHYITKCCIIPTAVLWTPVVILLPIAMLYQLLYYEHRSLLYPLLLCYEITYIICEIFPLLLYYQHRSLLHPLLLYFPYCCIINTRSILLVNFLRYSANMGENLGIAERFLISIIVV